MTRSSRLKLAGYSLSLAIPLLAPLSVHMQLPWLAPFLVFGVFPILGLVIGEDRSLPLYGLRRIPLLVKYLDNLPRVYGLVWSAVLVWALQYVATPHLDLNHFAALTLTVGIGSAVAICTAHELLHRRWWADIFLARAMTSLTFFGHMSVEHMHHHANIGDTTVGATATRGMSVYRFAGLDYIQALRNVWIVERARLRRSGGGWWRNRLLQDYGMGVGLLCAVYAIWGGIGLLLFMGQAIFAVFVFEVITYVHHYGLVRTDQEEAGPQHAWAHHCWITNCLTFNNTFHSDHHLRPRTPYYDLHAMYGAPRLPASYFTMFCVALIPSLWFALMNPRVDALDARAIEKKGGLPSWMRTQRCR